MKQIFKTITDFFKGNYSKEDLNEKIIEHINLFSARERFNAKIVEIVITDVPLTDYTYMTVEVYCVNPGKLIGRFGNVSSRLAGELSVLANCRVDLSVYRENKD